MGERTIEKCIFTNNVLWDNDFQDSDEGILSYTTEIKGNKHLFVLPNDAVSWALENHFFIKNKILFEGLLRNNSWVKNEKNLLSIKILEDLLNTKDFPKTPNAKADYLFKRLFTFQKEDGGRTLINKEEWKKFFWKELYFKSENELNFYIRHLNEQGLIEGVFNGFNEQKKLESFILTVKGLNYIIKLNDEGNLSDRCFVAMAFCPGTNEIREAIKSAIIETGFTPILIDEQHVDSDKTINDEIIAKLKKCKFCIADFTFHRNGVYFESGFALGQGKKVIYTCRKDQFKKAHFDIKPLQHIIYETTKELESKLIYKIEAWVK